MPIFKIYRTESFDRESEKIPVNEQQKIERFEKKQLKENPFVGDPLGYDFFREKRLNGRRVYYLIYKELAVVLLVAISDKKAQQETIDQIKLHLGLYYDFVKEIVKKI